MPLSTAETIAPYDSPQRRRRRRCFQRVMSGLEKGGHLRFLTLTSSDGPHRPIQKDLRCLIMRLRRRRLLDDYLRVIELTKRGAEHAHIIFRGSYIDQVLIGKMWQEIRNSPIIDIRSVRSDPHHRRIAALEMSKYMVKAGHRRYSWSWGWVYKGFVQVWRAACAIVRRIQTETKLFVKWTSFLDLWHRHLRTATSPNQFLGFLSLALHKA